MKGDPINLVEKHNERLASAGSHLRWAYGPPGTPGSAMHLTSIKPPVNKLQGLMNFDFPTRGGDGQD